MGTTDVTAENSNSEPEKKKTDQPSASRTALRMLATGMLIGLVSIPVYALHTGTGVAFLTCVSIGLLLAGSAALVGGILGFLFGIPRTLQQEGSGTGNADTSRRVDYVANTNLEQISDWLTKILVGVGLTQISEIRTGLASLTASAAQGLGSAPHSQVFAGALLAYSVVLGFLFGYLWTRLFLAGALRQADQASIGALKAQVNEITQKAETTDRKLEELKKQSALDAAALNMAYRQMNPSPDLPKVSEDDLAAAIAAASQPVKTQIFNQAWSQRGSSWRDPNTKEKMEQTIPVFRALTKIDTANSYHMNHGQLGFALKDQRKPDWMDAEKELTIAIQIRGPWQEHGWLFYEFNRAICRIMSDPAFIQDHPSDAPRKAGILEDLRASYGAKDLHPLIKGDPDIQKWMSINGVTDKQLKAP